MSETFMNSRREPHNTVGTRIRVIGRDATITAVNVDHLPLGVVEQITVTYDDTGGTEIVDIKGIRVGQDWIK
jgi:hypothetical protein